MKLKELDREIQKEIKSIIRGNGLKLTDITEIFKDGEKVAIEIAKINKIITVNF